MATASASGSRPSIAAPCTTSGVPPDAASVTPSADTTQTPKDRSTAASAVASDPASAVVSADPDLDPDPDSEAPGSDVAAGAAHVAAAEAAVGAEMSAPPF